MVQFSDVIYRKATSLSCHRLESQLIRLSLGADHLPRDAIETNNSEVVQTAYGKGIVDEAMQWNRDRESSSVDSSSDSGVLSTADSSGKSSRGLDPSTLYFKKEDVIMLVDGESHHRPVRKPCIAGQRLMDRLIRYSTVYENDLCSFLWGRRSS